MSGTRSFAGSRPMSQEIRLMMEERHSTDNMHSRARSGTQSSGLLQDSMRSVLSPSQVSFSGKMSLAKSFSRRVLTKDPRQRIASSSWGPMVGREGPEDEDLDEEILEEIVQIGEDKKIRPTKKNVRARLGYCKLLWHDFKIWKRRRKNKAPDIPFFKSSIKAMESNFGSGIGTFFVFTRFVILLNILLSILWLGFVILPTAVCFDYTSITQPFSYSNLFDGEGSVGESWLFYCAYTPQLGTNHLEAQTTSQRMTYHTGLAYLAMIIVTYFGSLLFILRSMASGSLPSKSEAAKARFRFALLTLCSWDHSISSAEAIDNLSMGIASSLKDNLYDAKAADLTEALSRKEKCKIYSRRITAWIITLILVGGGCTAIVYLVMFVNFSEDSFELTIDGVDVGKSMSGFQTYITPVAFSLINMLVPTCLSLLPKLELYASGKTELNVTLARVFILRMANLFALIMSLYNIMNKHTDTSHGAVSSSKCTGTVIGQELYKLVIMDTIIHTSVNLLVKFCSYLWTLKKSEFNISSSVLVLIYRQALIWIGTLACPVLPLVGTLSDLVFYYLMYGVIKHTCKPPIKRWAQSRNTVFFMSFLLLSLICLIVPVSLIIGSDILDLGKTHNITLKYGPFSNGVMPTSAYQDFLNSLHMPVLEKILMWIVSDTVILPSFFILMIVLVYQAMRISGEKKHGLILLAELQQERHDNKNLMKKLKENKMEL